MKGIRSARTRWLVALLVSSGAAQVLAAHPDIDAMVLPGMPGSNCDTEPPAAPITLLDAVDHALCADPRTAKAWAFTRQQVAEQLEASDARRPQLSLSNANGYARRTLEVFKAPFQDSNQHNSFNTPSFTLTWTLFDFGLTRARIERARQLLAAANMAEDSAAQAVIFDAATAFCNLLDAQASMSASVAAAAVARRSLSIVEGRLVGGLAPVTDRLEANTALLQASLKRAQAELDLQKAVGTLATRMGYRPSTRLEAADRSLPRPDDAFLAALDELLDEADERNPEIREARAKVMAAEADVVAARAVSKPSLTFEGLIVNRRDDYAQHDKFSPSETFGDSQSSYKRAQITLKIPIAGFDGHAEDARAARARLEGSVADLRDSRLHVRLDVWDSYYEIRTTSERARLMEEVVASASELLDASQKRYTEGVGGILDVLTAQNTLADQQTQLIHALSVWRLARLKLAQSLGDARGWVQRQ